MAGYHLLIMPEIEGKADWENYIGAGRGELDENKRGETYREMQQVLRDEGGVIVLAFANYVYAMREQVAHGEAMAANWELDGGRYVERWWMT